MKRARAPIGMLILLFFVSQLAVAADPRLDFLAYRFMGAYLPPEACDLLLKAQKRLGSPLTKDDVARDLAAILDATGEQLVRGPGFEYHAEGLSYESWIATPKRNIRFGDLKVGNSILSYDIATGTLVENQILDLSTTMARVIVYRDPGTETYICARVGQSFYAAIPNLPLPKFLTPALPREFETFPGAVVARILDLKTPSLVGEKLGLARPLSRVDRCMRMKVVHKPINFIANGYLIPLEF